MTKPCIRCGERKPLAEFYHHAQMADGHLNVCKVCVKARVRKHRRENESVREYDRQRTKTPAAKKRLAANTKRWREKNPERAKAQAVVNYALRTGKIKREPCYFCQATIVHAHHHDYSKPLEVTWLCPRCHHRLHALENAA